MSQPNAEPGNGELVLANTLAGVAVLAVVAITVPLCGVAFILNLPNAILGALERRERKYAAWPQPK